MSVRSVGQKASFDILAGDSSGDERSLSLRPKPLQNGFPVAPPTRRKRKSRKRKAAATAAAAELNGEMLSVRENGHCENFAAVEADSESLRLNGGSELRQRKLNGTVPEEAMGIQFTVLESRSVVETVCETTVVVPEPESLLASSASLGEVDESAGDGSGVTESSTMQWMPESNGSLTRLETVKSLDWKRVLAENPSVLGGDVSPVYRSPLKYFMGEIYGGSSLRSTISVGNDKKRQRVYNTVFHVPVRCERLIVAGFFVCLDSFLSLLTIMPARIAMTIWRVLTTRQFLRPNAAELSDFGCFIVLASGVTSLQLTDISLIYHIIRGQGILKLYVVYNVLEIFDKLCQSFGEDVLQVLFNSAEGLATCSADKVKFELLRFIFDQTIAVTAFIVHSFVLLAQAITLSTCIIAHNNALLALLVSNNFAEIKSNVFKRVSKENLHNLVYYDIVERFHISAFVLFVLAQNILEAEGPWFGSFLTNALLVFMCEVFIDMIKHSFLAKFNEIKPIAYSEFLEDLCKQTLNEKPEERGTDLTFIPLAPACVVIRVLTPIYASLLPIGPLPWRLTWILIWCSLTYVMIAACKIMVGLALHRLATWYLSQCLKKKQHMD